MITTPAKQLKTIVLAFINHPFYFNLASLLSEQSSHGETENPRLVRVVFHKWRSNLKSHRHRPKPIWYLYLYACPNRGPVVAAVYRCAVHEKQCREIVAYQGHGYLGVG